MLLFFGGHTVGIVFFIEIKTQNFDWT